MGKTQKQMPFFAPERGHRDVCLATDDVRSPWIEERALTVATRE
jgi:hypothetical protein